MKPYDPSNPGLSKLFCDVVQDAFESDLGRTIDDEIVTYIGQLLERFLHTDQIFAIKNSEGASLVSIAEMVVEGDIRLGANSFERERQVHRHIGDFLLFWSGLYPEFLRQIKLKYGSDLICDYMAQGKESYHVVSTFDIPPHDREAPTFRKLSQEFELYAYGLRSVSHRLGRLDLA